MKKTNKKMRLDHIIFERGLVKSRELARSFIMEGRILTNGRKAVKPGIMLPYDAVVEIIYPPEFVSRGGIKLAGALDALNVDPRGLTALDVGASTGGFTDCLLQRGAELVYAIDVGRGQLDYRLNQNPQVISMEKVNAHHPFYLPRKVQLVTIDVSFISVTKVIPNVIVHMRNQGSIIVLVKPQFEAKRTEVGKGGIIKDPQVHARVLGQVISSAMNMGLRPRNIVPSSILGTKGNQEYFVLFKGLNHDH